jgi:hypothetical protein
LLRVSSVFLDDVRSVRDPAVTANASLTRTARPTSDAASTNSVETDRGVAGEIKKKRFRSTHTIAAVSSIMSPNKSFADDERVSVYVCVCVGEKRGRESV